MVNVIAPSMCECTGIGLWQAVGEPECFTCSRHVYMVSVTWQNNQCNDTTGRFEEVI